MTEKTETGSESEAENSGAENLDDLLNEFESSEQTTEQTKTESVSSKELAELARLLKHDRQEKLNERAKNDLAEMTRTIRGDLEVDDDLVEGWADRRAAKDPRLQKAWNERHNNPEAYKRVLNALKGEFQERYGEKFSKPEQDTRESVEAAVRSASTRTQDAKPLTKDAWRNMTPQQRREEMAKHGVR